MFVLIVFGEWEDSPLSIYNLQTALLHFSEKRTEGLFALTKTQNNSFAFTHLPPSSVLNTRTKQLPTSSTSQPANTTSYQQAEDLPRNDAHTQTRIHQS